MEVEPEGPVVLASRVARYRQAAASDLRIARFVWQWCCSAGWEQVRARRPAAAVVLSACTPAGVLAPEADYELWKSCHCGLQRTGIIGRFIVLIAVYQQQVWSMHALVAPASSLAGRVPVTEIKQAPATTAQSKL